MSDEQHENEDPEVEGHVRKGVTSEPSAEDENEYDVEAHVRHANIRMDSPRDI